MSALRLTQDFIAGARSLIPDMLRGEAAKSVASKTGASLRAVEAWKAGQSLPGIAHVGALIAAYPQFRSFIVRWAEQAAQPDFLEPRVQRDFHAMLAAFTKIGGKP